MFNDSFFSWLFLVILVLLIVSALTGCTQWSARHGFGKMTTNLECNTKLVNVTWKGQDAEMWTLTRPFKQDDVPETYQFKASTLFGLFEGEVIFLEKKC